MFKRSQAKKGAAPQGSERRPATGEDIAAVSRAAATLWTRVARSGSIYNVPPGAMVWMDDKSKFETATISVPTGKGTKERIGVYYDEGGVFHVRHTLYVYSPQNRGPGAIIAAESRTYPLSAAGLVTVERFTCEQGEDGEPEQTPHEVLSREEEGTISFTAARNIQTTLEVFLGEHAPGPDRVSSYVPAQVQRTVGATVLADPML